MSGAADGFDLTGPLAGGPLAGVRVLDLTRLLPGAFCMSLLADFGAEVVKVEQPGIGDYMRWGEPRIGGESAASWVTDRNKRSIALDLKRPEGVAVLKRLAAQAEVMVEGFRPGVVARLGIDYEAMRAVNPALVYCSISGYGQHGPLTAAAGHDINYMGRAGLLSITGPADGDPAVPGVQIADLAGGGLLAAVGILAALTKARAGGSGDHVDVAMTDGAFALQSIHLGDYFASGVVPAREQMALNGRYPCYGVYRCRDGRHITVGALEPRFFAELCRGVGREDLIDTAFEESAKQIWREVFLARDRDRWLADLEGFDACVGPVNDFAEACRDPQMIAREMIVEIADHAGGRHRQVGVPIKLREHAGTLRTPAPRLGEATREYLELAGCPQSEIEHLLAEGIAAEHGSDDHARVASESSTSA